MSGRRAGNPDTRRRILLAGVLLCALLTAGRSFQLGVLEAEVWRERALNQQGDTLPLPAPRGTIYDRDGMPLAASREVYRVAIAPREVRDRAGVRRLLQRHLDISAADAARHLDRGRVWAVLPGRYGEQARVALDDIEGVYFERVLQRFYPNGSLAREVLGSVSPDGLPLGGLELELDSVLSGTSGLAVLRRDARGRPLPGAMMRAVEPAPGRDVYLTIDHDLQEIADQALADAIARTEAAGGEMLLVDPRTGEVLAAVSRSRTGRSRSWRAVLEPYEPGSTLKPFTVAALLTRGLAALGDSVYGEEGRDDQLRLSDVHPHGWMTLAGALRESSNIGIARMGARLQPGEQYVTMRDFGFGSPTGVGYPTESAGRLYRPAQWSATSASRLAIGYEIAVTPLQVAMAYAALANGGDLLEPRLVREVRSRGGRVERSFAPGIVRRVMPSAVAESLREVLADAVEDGTARNAALGGFRVAGKTGTARIASGGGYRAGAYISSFAGFFPAGDPQLVFMVKLDEPRGQYYGGLTAAPVTRATLEAALAAHNTPLDRSAVAHSAPLGGAASSLAPARGSTRPLPTRAVVQLRSPAAAEDIIAPAPETAGVFADAGDGVSVPDVAGLPLRDGVRRLHAAGFRVRVEGRGRILRTVPAADAAASADRVVRLIAEESA